MASVTTLLLLLLLIPAPSASYYYMYYGGSLTFTPKGGNSNGTYEVELRNKQTTRHCYTSGYSCAYGDCGSQIQYTTQVVSRYPNYWDHCQTEVVIRRRLNSNRPFEIKYPNYHYYYYCIGYWVANVRSYRHVWKLSAYVDLGTRSDTGKSNRSPITTMPPLLRVTRNCPRSINITVFDPDGDRVRCRTGSSLGRNECGLCGLTSGFTLDQNSCSLQYIYSHHNGYHPIELVLEDFARRYVRLSYSDGSYIWKSPLSVGRHKRDASFNETAGPVNATASSVHATAAPVNGTAAPPHATAAPVNGTAAPPHATAAPVNRTAAPPHATAAPVNRTAAPPHATAAPVNRTAAPPHATAAPVNATAAPVNRTAAPVNRTAAPVTRTAAPSHTTTAPDRTTISPLSKIPLQFSVYVDSHYAPSCADGDYFPIFLSPTPYNGARFPALVNQTVEIKVRSSAQNTTIVRLIITGPQGIHQQNTGPGEYIIRWTPSENELNDYFPICFVSEARDIYHQLYHSELRCVLIDVGSHKTTVTCSETTMTVEVEKSYFIRLYEEKLHLNDFKDPSCSLNSNATHLMAVMSLTECGTHFDEDENNIIFKNRITNADTTKVISRKHDVDIDFSCVYPKQTNLTVGFRHKNPYAFSEKGFGAFTFQFEFFESERFRRQVNSSSYPVEVSLKQMMYMQIEATTSIPHVELFVESCRATPYDNPRSRITYTIIEHGCVRDDTVQIYPSSKYQFRFGMEAFEFIGAHDEVYITCSVILCETGVSGTRCSQGCTSPNSGKYRGKRAALAQTSSRYISQGPLHLAKPSANPASSLSLNLGLNLAFVVGCLLVCGVLIYRSRSSRPKYQQLSTSDTD